MDSLARIYRRLVDGGAGNGFVLTTPFPSVRFRLVDGFDYFGKPVEKAVPWFELSATARTMEISEEKPAEEMSFHGAGTGFNAALGNLLEHMSAENRCEVIWPENPFSAERAKTYLAEHPLFGMMTIACARVHKQSLHHGEVCTVEIGPYRRNAIAFDPFLGNFKAVSEEELLQNLAYRVQLAYSDCEVLPSRETLWSDYCCMAEEGLDGQVEFFFEGDGITFRPLEKSRHLPVPKEPGTFEEQMALLAEYARLLCLRRTGGADK